MSKSDQERFDRDVRFIRRKYGGRDKWKDAASVFAHFFRMSREPVRGESNLDAETSLVGLIRLSQIDKHMWDAANLIAQDHLTSGVVLPDPLAHWVSDLLADQTIPRESRIRPRPAKGRGLRVRDWMMWIAVADLVERGYTATRREGVAQASAKGGTACDVVGKAFFKSYKTIEGVWYSKPPQLSLPGSPKEPPR